MIMHARTLSRENSKPPAANKHSDILAMCCEVISWYLLF